MATRLIKFSFHSNTKEGQCQRMFKLPHNCTYFTIQQGLTQYSPNQSSTVHELRTSGCTNWIQKTQRNQRSNCQHLLDRKKARGFQKKHLLLLHWRRKWQPTPVVLPGKSHGRRSLVGYNPWGRRESDTTERLYLLYFTFCFIDYARAINCVNHNKLENSQRDGNTRPPHLPPA